VEIGSRVAYVLAEKARCGVVVGIDGDLFTIKLDDGKTKLNVSNNNRLHLINYWRDLIREVSVDKLPLLSDDKTAMEIFKSNRPIVFGVAAVRAMWYWANKNVFNGVLKEPTFHITSSKKTFGKWWPNKKLMELSLRNMSSKQLFGVVMHEMIHQVNSEYEWPRGEYNLNEGGHGAGFQRWIPIVKDITGVKVAQFVDTQDKDVDNSEKGKEPKTKSFIFACCNLYKEYYYGYILPDKETLETFASRLRAFQRQHNPGGDGRVYAGISDSARIKREFLPLTTGNARTYKIDVRKSILPPMLVYLKHHFEPIEGFYGPDRAP
jgi:hypothetical protein